MTGTSTHCHSHQQRSHDNHHCHDHDQNHCNSQVPLSSCTSKHIASNNRIEDNNACQVNHDHRKHHNHHEHEHHSHEHHSHEHHSHEHHSHEHHSHEHHSHDHSHDSEQEVTIQVDTAAPVPIMKRPTRHLSLGVTKMHCNSCGGSLEGVLGKITGIVEGGVRVSWVLHRVEIWYYTEDYPDEPELIETLKTRTGYSLLYINSVSDVENAESGCLVRLKAEKTNLLAETLEGMEGVKRASIFSKEAEVIYDPKTIGVRDIISSLNAGPDGGFRVAIADQPDLQAAARNADSKSLRILGIKTLLATLITIPVLVLAWVTSLNVPSLPKGIVEFVCATIVVVIAREIPLNAIRKLFFGGPGGRVDIDVLISMATLTAYGYSVGVFAKNVSSPGSKGVPFFETSALVLCLIMGGRWMTGALRKWAVSRIAFGGALQETSAELVELGLIDTRLLQYGDNITARPGDKIATDGIVTRGNAQVDASHITGETTPSFVDDKMESQVIAGSTIVDGEIIYRVIRLLEENTLSSIQKMVTIAGKDSMRIQKIADRVAKWLTPTILLIAFVDFLVWLLILGLSGKSWSGSAVIASTYAISVLAISCPCPIGLAVPLVQVVATRTGFKKAGVLVKNPVAMERGCRIGRVVFDKTGTLTNGILEIVYSKFLLPGQDDKIRELIAKVCCGDPHPVSKAMIKYCNVKTNTKKLTTQEIGQGLSATIDGKEIKCGKSSWCRTSGSEEHPSVTEVEELGFTVFAISIGGVLSAVFGLTDTIRPEAFKLVENLRKKNLQVFIISGDHSRAVYRVAEKLGIPENDCRAGCLPEEKRVEIRRLQSAENPENRGKDIILFIGDGTNDAIALGQADVGITMSQSTSIAIDAADVTILSNSLDGLLGFLELSKRARICIWLNFFWALVWNLFAILGASGAFVVFRIPPALAGLGELASILPIFVISGAVGIRWRHKLGERLPEV